MPKKSTYHNSDLFKEPKQPVPVVPKQTEQEAHDDHINESGTQIFEKAEKANKGIVDFLNMQSGLVEIFIRVGLIVKEILIAIPWAATIVLVYTSLFRAVMAAVASKEKTSTRIIQVLAAIGGLAIGITAIIVTALPLLIAAIAIDTAQYLWQAAHAVKDYFFGAEIDLKKEKEDFYAKLSVDKEIETAFLDFYVYKDKSISFQRLPPEKQFEVTKLYKDFVDLHQKENAKRKEGGEAGEKVHTFMLSALSLVGAGLLFTPAAPIGAGILIGVAFYGLMHKFVFNPFKWLGNKLFESPFQEKALPNSETIMDELKTYQLEHKALHVPKHEEVHESTAQLIEVIAAENHEDPIRIAQETVKSFSDSESDSETDSDSDAEKVSPEVHLHEKSHEGESEGKKDATEKHITFDHHS